MSLEVVRRNVRGWVLLVGWIGWFGLAGVGRAQSIPPGALPCVTNDVPDGYGTFLMARGAWYLQASEGAPVEASAPSGYTAFELRASPAMIVSNTVVGGPNGYRLELEPLEERLLRGVEGFGSEEALNATVVPGPWSTRLDITLPDSAPFLGFFRFTVSDQQAPPIPQMGDLAALQALDNGTNVVLGWNAWPGLGAGDRVHLELRDAAGAPVFSAATGCGGEVSLAAGDTSVVLPAGRLAARSTYSGYLTFSSSVFAAQDRGTLLVQRGVRTRTTRFTVRTTGSLVADAVLSDPRLAASGTNLIFTIRGTPRTSYMIQSSADMTTWRLERVIQLAISGVANVSLPLPRDGTPRFWRAVPPNFEETPPTVRLGFPAQSRDFLQITIEGTPGLSYRVESSTTLNQWNPIGPFALTIPVTSTRVTFGVPYQRTSRFAAFRAVQVVR